MSRIGKLPIELPSGVNAEISDGSVTISGPKGSLSQQIPHGISVDLQGSQLVVKRSSDEALDKANHGLIRSLLANMVEGVNQGFSRQLEIHGVGYRAQNQGNELKLNLGYSHDVIYKVPEGVTASVDQNKITVTGISKQQVGQTAAEIRALRKPEPYKGKGIRYSDEKVLRKSGKSTKE
ncbi:50S ribosomal protein L6 [Candidatus Saccharibacteria bacterium RIFCSPLOWO2_01_FULL_48_13]|nr:MAG: 50S ribosomal protein L6 [Candidatus Saccharibacteria bacterium RIFCSPHIGHO2_01_FULL_48_12]OGL35327.1 MAG: 50S ribosomal protein L6 [Candidatus Saccharibacteria bacterium RIFCSPHIGHO2_12_FULL_48_21]OGL37562.1 MAG: 50S ribosomal protein L6 [Candidatus Saccharibacteria bacterium RIFCSPLOWO2_01_FULL_48_13]